MWSQLTHSSSHTNYAELGGSSPALLDKTIIGRSGEELNKIGLYLMTNHSSSHALSQPVLSWLQLTTTYGSHYRTVLSLYFTFHGYFPHFALSLTSKFFICHAPCSLPHTPRPPTLQPLRLGGVQDSTNQDHHLRSTSVRVQDSTE